jgi:hypothetical protein
MLHIHVHHPGDYSKSVGKESSLKLISGPADFCDVLETEISDVRRRILVMGALCHTILDTSQRMLMATASVDTTSRLKLRKSVANFMNDKTRYFEPDFQPPESFKRAFMID